MKKNKMMRVASGVAVLTLLTTCAISGTFAKYTTGSSASDTARVAKFGVTVTASDASMFSKSYDTENGTVVSTEQVVAPGTKNETGLTFTVAGESEVAVRLDFAMTVDKDVSVKAGSYLDWTTGNDTTDTFELTDNYTPVVFTLKKDSTEVKSGTLAEVAEAFAALSTKQGENVAVGTSFAATYTLTWAWAYDTEAGNGANDKADTLLGNVAAGTAVEGVETKIDFDMSITVTQVD